MIKANRSSGINCISSPYEDALTPRLQESFSRFIENPNHYSMHDTLALHQAYTAEVFMPMLNDVVERYFKTEDPQEKGSCMQVVLYYLEKLQARLNAEAQLKVAGSKVDSDSHNNARAAAYFINVVTEGIEKLRLPNHQQRELLEFVNSNVFGGDVVEGTTSTPASISLEMDGTIPNRMISYDN